MPVANVAPRLSSRPLSHHLPHNNNNKSYTTILRRSNRLSSRFLLRTTCCYSTTTNGNSPNDQFPHHRPIDDDFFTNFHTSSSSSTPSDFFHHHHHTSSTTTTTTTTRFRPTKLDLLQPSLLGIRTDPPDWPERDEMIRFRIARRASCVELPLSLRMIKIKKKKPAATKLPRESTAVSLGISTALYSTVSVVRELQTHALRLRGLEFDSEVENKVESEMKSSFIWLFREVFSKTPDLMLDVMLLTVDFASTSIENNLMMMTTTTTTPPLSTTAAASDEKHITSTSTTTTTATNTDVNSNGTTPLTVSVTVPMSRFPKVTDPGETPTETLKSNSKSVTEIISGRNQIMDEMETNLWYSMVEEASTIWKTPDEQQPLQFVSPVRVKIESDDYAEYDRTNLLYQISITEQPQNAMLLSNYAQFLYLVERDHNRADECFQRAIQVDSSDPEIMSQYATFLWVIRNDLWGAEERYQQAMSIEPENAYYASKYANFLWNTGGDETCYPGAS